jgi:hypothetical protein
MGIQGRSGRFEGSGRIGDGSRVAVERLADTEGVADDLFESMSSIFYRSAAVIHRKPAGEVET